MEYVLEKRLVHPERFEQHDLSTAAYLKIVAEIPSNHIIVLNLKKF